MHLDALHYFNPEALQATVVNAGMWGPLLYAAVIAISVVISQIPGAPLAVVAGTIWPPLWAGLYTVVGGLCGALMAYGLGKSIGQPIVKKLTGKTLSFSDEESEQTLAWMIFVTRLVPVVSFDLVSYGAGMTGLSLPLYAGATLLGMIPSTLLLTFMGDRIQFDSSIVLSLGIAFALLFIGIPFLMHRYNWLNLRTLVSWE